MRRSGVLQASRSSRRTHTLTKYVMELSLSEYAVLRFKASVVAAACVYIARAMTRHSPVWVQCRCVVSVIKIVR